MNLSNNPYRTILQGIQFNLNKSIKVIDTLNGLKEQFLKADIQNEVGLKRIQELIDYLTKRWEPEELNIDSERIQLHLYYCVELQTECLNLKSK